MGQLQGRRGGAHLPEALDLEAEREAEGVLERGAQRPVVLQQLPQAPPQRRLHVLKLPQPDRRPEQLLVERQREREIEQHSVVDGQADDETEEHVLVGPFEAVGLEPEKKEEGSSASRAGRDGFSFLRYCPWTVPFSPHAWLRPPTHQYVLDSG